MKSFAWACCLSLAEMRVQIPSEALMSILRVLCFFPVRGTCDWPIPRPDES